MSQMQKCFMSGLLSLACSAALFSGFHFVDNTDVIKDLALKANKSVYLKSQREMNAEMAEIMLPYLQRQNKEEEAKNKVKKPNMVYVPEQLQNSGGY